MTQISENHNRCRWSAMSCARQSIAFLVALLAVTPIARGADDVTQLTSAPTLATTDQIDPGIPTPASIIGHAAGERAVRYAQLERYLHALADASPRVTLTPYGTSHEGRTLYYLTITSEANHAMLEKIKTANARLADPRKLSNPAEAEHIIESMPGIAWLAYSIHGDELSGTDAAIEVAYQLAAGMDAPTQRLRDQLVINIDPSMNPDGRERYLAQLQHLMGKVPNPDYQSMQHGGLWSAGRGNHYLFDLNRDWLMHVHPETRGRAEAIQTWNPHLLVDAHEMGGQDTYLFDPPREPRNPELAPGNLAWRQRFSADQAQAFDRHGWSYYTREWYEEWYPGYSNAWANLLGAVGILYEQAGYDAAPLTMPSGEVVTYRQAVFHQFVSSMANLETLRANRQELLRDFHDTRREAVLDQEGAEVFLLPPSADRSKVTQLLELIRRQGIEFTVAEQAFEAQDATDLRGMTHRTLSLPAGTTIVRSNQPHRNLLRAILGFDPHMTDTFLHDERKDLENHRGSRVYDITAWNLCMAYGLEAFWASSITEPSQHAIGHIPVATHKPMPLKHPAYGYLIHGANSAVYRALVELFDRDYKVRVATKPFTVGGQDYPIGSLLLRHHENEDVDVPWLRTLQATWHFDVQPAETALCESGPDLGGRRFVLLVPPRIAIASQWPTSTTSFGSVWHLLDVRLGLRASPVNIQRLGRIDLRKYNVLVLPNARGLGSTISEGVRGKLRKWVSAGGTLVAMGGSAAFLASEDKGLSAVRLRRNVLEQLDEYAEALTRERSARAIDVDPNTVWGAADVEQEDAKVEPKNDEDGSEDEKSQDGKPPSKEKKKKNDAKKAKRLDRWQRMFSPSGAMLGAWIDAEHWLCAGVGNMDNDLARGKPYPVLMGGGYAFLSKYPVATPVRFVQADDLRLSGLLWPEARTRLADSAYATVERMGHGQIILFARDPMFRGYTEGTARLLVNALLLGPGVGASRADPW